jgi:hypothetical protein
MTATVTHKKPVAGHAGRIVQRTDYRLLSFQQGIDLAVFPDVVAGGDDVHAGIKELLGGSERQATSAGGVLAISDY